MGVTISMAGSTFCRRGSEEQVVRLTLAEHPTGQQADAFEENGGETDAELFSFQLQAPPAETAAIHRLAFTLSELSGLTNPDWAGIELMHDANANGDVDGGEAAVGGAGTVDTVGGTVTFSNVFSIAMNTASNYILRADFASLAAGDKFSVALYGSNITCTATTSEVSIETVGTASRTSHWEVGAVTISEHDAGQEADAFTETGEVSNVELYAFKLEVPDTEDAEIHEIVFDITSINGLPDGQWSGVELIVDENADGKS